MQNNSSDSKKSNYISFLFDTNLIDLNENISKGFIDHLGKKFSNKFKVYMWRTVTNLSSSLKSKSIEVYVDNIPDDGETVTKLFSEYSSFFKSQNIEKSNLSNIRVLEYIDEKVNIYELQ